MSESSDQQDCCTVSDSEPAFQPDNPDAPAGTEKNTQDGRRKTLRWILRLVGLAILWILFRHSAPDPPRPLTPTSDGGLGTAAVLLGITLIGVIVSLVQLRASGRKTWEPLKTDEIRWTACLDTVLIAIGYVVAAMHADWALLMALTIMMSGYIFSAHLPAGVHVAVRELLAFYGTVSMWDVVTFRVPHKRLHPGCSCENHEPWDEDPPEIRSVGDVMAIIVGNILLFPAIASTILVKASSLLMFPLIYIALSFDARDYLELSLEARQRWRSSFKIVWVSTACFSLFLFAAKLIVYAQWNNIADYWNSSTLCAWIDRPVAPRCFYVWHITIVLNAILVLLVAHLVDRVVHLLEDRSVAPEKMAGKLRTIRCLFRIRTILSFYNWVCLMALVFPLLHHSLPEITWVVFPR